MDAFFKNYMRSYSLIIRRLPSPLSVSDLTRNFMETIMVQKAYFGDIMKSNTKNYLKSFDMTLILR